ncbi:hypothetical protein EVA_16618 [gut metagenome]|uniref:Uncharacterized protein n=1 Tax=gut metagenome TaxID=749906 RepID=J9G6Z6_9ZZZZ
MWQRSYIDNFCNFNTSTMNGSDSRFTTITRSLDICFYLSQAKIIGNLCTILGSHLSCIRSVLLRTPKSHFSG